MNKGVEHQKSRSFGLFLVVAGVITFLALSIGMILATPNSLADFRHVFCSARCLIENSDPYLPSNEMRVYRGEGIERAADSDDDQLVVARYIYPPTEFVITLPFALLPFAAAQLLWVSVTAATFIIALLLIWHTCARDAPEMAGGLLCFLVANSEQIMVYGNPAGIALSLCVISVWCFLQEKFIPIGVISMVASLALKPQESALIWLLFLITRGPYRRFALQTLIVLLLLCIPITLHVSRIAPGWVQELRSNWAVFSVHGGMNDPGPGSHNNSAARFTNLQSVFSVFRDSPVFYNAATYLIFGSMFIVWATVTLRARQNRILTWFALAAIAPMSMLPVYHRIYDAKLIILTLPACALLWAERGLIGRVAVVITTAGFFVSADLPWAAYLHTLSQFHLYPSAQPGLLITTTLNFPLPIVMLLMSGFYLYVYARRASDSGIAQARIE